MDASCECGKIAFKTPLEKPLGLHICHCLQCRLETAGPCGASAIFPAFEWQGKVKKEDLGVYVRKGEGGLPLNCYFCKHCSVRVIQSIPGKQFIAIKAGCIRDLDWSTARHIWTRASAIPIDPGFSQDHEEPSSEPDRTYFFSSHIPRPRGAAPSLTPSEKVEKSNFLTFMARARFGFHRGEGREPLREERQMPRSVTIVQIRGTREGDGLGLGQERGHGQQNGQQRGQQIEQQHGQVHQHGHGPEQGQQQGQLPFVTPRSVETIQLPRRPTGHTPSPLSTSNTPHLATPSETTLQQSQSQSQPQTTLQQSHSQSHQRQHHGIQAPAQGTRNIGRDYASDDSEVENASFLRNVSARFRDSGWGGGRFISRKGKTTW